MANVVVRAALPSVRLGLTTMLSEHRHVVVAEAAAPDDAVWVVDGVDQDTLDLLHAHRYTDLPRAVVVLSDDPTAASGLARAELRGWACLGRDCAAEDLALAVQAADRGFVLLDRPTAAASIPVAARVSGAETLTPRELQVLQLLAQGLPNKGIAQRLGISENTVKYHVASVCARLGAGSRTEAVTLGARRGLLLL